MLSIRLSLYRGLDSRFQDLDRRTDRRTRPLCIFQMVLPRVNTRVFLFSFSFSHPFPASCPGLIPGFFFRPFLAGCPRLILRFFCFFFPPFFDGFVMYGKTGLCIFQMALPRVNTMVFFFFFFSRPFPAGCLGLIPRFYYYFFFPPLTDNPTQAIAF